MDKILYVNDNGMKIIFSERERKGGEKDIPDKSVR